MSAPLVWVVEDNDANFELVEYVLEALGCRICRASSLCELEALQTGEPPVLVLLDENLPDGSGLDAVQTLRADATFAQLPILALTAHAMSGDRNRFLEAGFTEYLSKPISPTDLATAVKHYLSRVAEEP